MSEMPHYTIAEIARLARKPNGKHFSVAAVHGWIKQGIRGVKLPASRVGGTYYISALEWLRFYRFTLTVPCTTSNITPEELKDETIAGLF